MESALYQEIFSDGRRQGAEDGLSVAREAVGDLCELAGIELTAERRAQIEAMDLKQLKALCKRIKERRAW